MMLRDKKLIKRLENFKFVFKREIYDDAKERCDQILENAYNVKQVMDSLEAKEAGARKVKIREMQEFVITYYNKLVFLFRHVDPKVLVDVMELASHKKVDGAHDICSLLERFRTMNLVIEQEMKAHESEIILNTEYNSIINGSKNFAGNLKITDEGICKAAVVESQVAHKPPIPSLETLKSYSGFNDEYFFFQKKYKGFNKIDNKNLDDLYNFFVLYYNIFEKMTKQFDVNYMKDVDPKLPDMLLKLFRIMYKIPELDFLVKCKDDDSLMRDIILNKLALVEGGKVTSDNIVTEFIQLVENRLDLQKNPIQLSSDKRKELHLCAREKLATLSNASDDNFLEKYESFVKQVAQIKTEFPEEYVDHIKKDLILYNTAIDLFSTLYGNKELDLSICDDGLSICDRILDKLNVPGGEVTSDDVVIEVVQFIAEQLAQKEPLLSQSEWKKAYENMETQLLNYMRDDKHYKMGLAELQNLDSLCSTHPVSCSNKLVNACENGEILRKIVELFSNSLTAEEFHEFETMFNGEEKDVAKCCDWIVKLTVKIAEDIYNAQHCDENYNNEYYDGEEISHNRRRISKVYGQEIFRNSVKIINFLFEEILESIKVKNDQDGKALESLKKEIKERMAHDFIEVIYDETTMENEKVAFEIQCLGSQMRKVYDLLYNLPSECQEVKVDNASGKDNSTKGDKLVLEKGSLEGKSSEKGSLENGSEEPIELKRILDFQMNFLDKKIHEIRKDGYQPILPLIKLLITSEIEREKAFSNGGLIIGPMARSTTEHPRIVAEVEQSQTVPAVTGATIEESSASQASHQLSTIDVEAENRSEAKYPEMENGVEQSLKISKTAESMAEELPIPSVHHRSQVSTTDHSKKGSKMELDKKKAIKVEEIAEEPPIPQLQVKAKAAEKQNKLG